MLLPNKKTIDKAIADGTLPKIDRILSAAHLLTCIADYYMQEAEDLTRGCGFCLGEVKQAQTAYTQHMERYNSLWTQLVSDSHMSRERTEDFDTFMPVITRLLQIGQLITDTNTGKPVSESKPSSPSPSGGAGGGIFRIMRSSDDVRMPYCSAKLTKEQKQALGKDVRITFTTHANIKKLIEHYAAKDDCPQRDVINEALIQCIENHK